MLCVLSVEVWFQSCLLCKFNRIFFVRFCVAFFSISDGVGIVCFTFLFPAFLMFCIIGGLVVFSSVYCQYFDVWRRFNSSKKHGSVLAFDILFHAFLFG